MVSVEVDAGMLKLVSPHYLMRQVGGSHLERGMTLTYSKSKRNVDLDVVPSLWSCPFKCENDLKIGSLQILRINNLKVSHDEIH